MKKMFWPILALVLGTAALSACSSTEDTVGEGGDGSGNDSTLVPSDDKYPADAIVWHEDSTVVLTDHLVIPEGKSLYIEPGVKVVASDSTIKPEIVVLGNLYSMGTAEKPVTFTIADNLKTDRFCRNWGGIICGFDCKELYLDHTIMEYCGARTTENSPSFQHQLFKTETGEGVPAVHFCNPDGSMIITNCTFRNNAEDQIYITGGKSIVANNRFITSGYDGGEAINYKSDCLADIAYNLIYDANTNGFKLSNSGFTALQSDLNVYNNTIVNSGWRRPSKKGGSIWLESNILVNLCNNLIYDCRWGIKESTEEGEGADPNCVITPNYYFASTAAGVEQMTPNTDLGILSGADDIRSLQPGQNNPLFVNFTQQSNININVGGNADGAPVAFNDSWDFHLQAGSPALTGGTTNVPRHFGSQGITISGLQGILSNNVFTSPAPSTYFGAFGTK